MSSGWIKKKLTAFPICVKLFLGACLKTFMNIAKDTSSVKKKKVWKET